MRRIGQWVLTLFIGGIGFLILKGQTLPLNLEPDCLFVKADRVFDGLHPGYQNPGNFVVRQGRIVDVSATAPKSCRTIDVSTLTLLPGLIDVHTHLLLLPHTHEYDSTKIIPESVQFSKAQRLHQGELNAISMLRSGFTQIRDLGNSGSFLDAELLHHLQSKKEGLTPDFEISGPGIAAPPTQLGTTLPSQKEYRIWNSGADASAWIEENKSHQASWLKLYADNDPASGEISPDDLKSLTKLAHASGLRVAIHAITPSGVAAALSSGADSIEHFHNIPDQIPKEMNTWPAVVLTEIGKADCERAHTRSDDPLFADCTRFLSERRKVINWLKQHQVKFVFGSDSYADFGFGRGEMAIHSLLAWTELGFSPVQALQAATFSAAELLDHRDQGHLSVGAKADFIAVSGDPLADLKALKQIRWVVKAGQVICDPDEACADDR